MQTQTVITVGKIPYCAHSLIFTNRVLPFSTLPDRANRMRFSPKASLFPHLVRGNRLEYASCPKESQGGAMEE